MLRRPSTLAKTTRPSLEGIVPRTRLFERLDHAQQRSVVWVNGPPGSGKTTLVASYVEERRLASLWYQLDRGDSDAARFFYYLGTALDADLQPPQTELPLYTDEYHSDLAAFAGYYFQGLYQRFSDDFVLVFDGFQEIAPQSSLHEVIRNIVLTMPAHGSAIFISRNEPPSSMIRFRANRSMEVIGWEDLRLTRKEMDAIVHLWGIELADQTLQQLYEKTEGWAAGLALLLDSTGSSVSLQDLPALDDHHLIYDYLADEVFRTLDKDVQEFLLNTAYLSQMTIPMAQALGARENAQQILDQLRRDYHFVSMRPGRSGNVYQYHPLLQGFLNTRAAQELSADRNNRLLTDSAAHLAGAGDIEEAVRLLVRLEDWEGMTRIILEHAPTMQRHGRLETLDQWLQELPEKVQAQHPWIFYWRAVGRFSTAPRESRNLYAQAFECFSTATPPDKEGCLLACCGVMDSIHYELDDLSLLDRWMPVLADLLESNEGELSDLVEAKVTASMFMALLLRQPQHIDIEHWAERAYNISQNLTDVNLRLSLEPLVVISAIYVGFQEKAKSIIDDLRGLCKSSSVSPLALTSVRNVESTYFMFTAQHEACLKAVYDGLEIASSSGVHIWSYHLLSNGVAGALGAGDLVTAGELLERMQAYPERRHRMVSALFHYYSAWYAMLEGDTPRAYQEQKTALRRATESGCQYYEILCRLAMAQILLEYGDPAQAASQLRRVQEKVAAHRNRHLKFTTLLVTASMAIKVGDRKTELHSLSEALAIGRENAYKHFLWWQPNMMSTLCQRALDADIESQYVRSVIRDRALTPANPHQVSELWPWQLRVHSLGKFSILKDDETLGFMSRIQLKPMELLKAIIAHGGEDINEDRIAEALWPGVDGDYAHRSLATTLHRLRKILGEDQGAIILLNGRLSLNRNCWWLDIWALEQVFNDLDSLLHRQTVRSTLAEHLGTLADRLFSLYRGPFMESETERPWHITQRQKLHSRFIRLVGELGFYFDEHGRPEQAALCYKRGIEADALAETLYRRLMLCYRKQERYAEAIDLYENCKKNLKTTQNTVPSPETQAVFDTLLKKIGEDSA